MSAAGKSTLQRLVQGDPSSPRNKKRQPKQKRPPPGVPPQMLRNRQGLEAILSCARHHQLLGLMTSLCSLGGGVNLQNLDPLLHLLPSFPSSLPPSLPVSVPSSLFSPSLAPPLRSLPSSFPTFLLRLLSISSISYCLVFYKCVGIRARARSLVSVHACRHAYLCEYNRHSENGCISPS